MENTKILTELVGSDFNEKARMRAIDATRVASLARAAAKKAETNGDNSLADRLNAEATELEQAAANWNSDTISKNSNQSNSADTPTNSKDKQDNGTGEKKENPEQQETENPANSNKNSEETGENTSNKDSAESEANGKDEQGKDSSVANNKEGSNPLGAENTADGKDSQKQSSDAQSSNTSSSNSDGDQSSSENSSKGDDSDSSSAGGSNGDSGEDSEEDDSDSGDNDSEEDDDDFEEDETDPIKDIFGMSKPSGGAFGKATQKNPRDPTIEEIKKMLNRLHGEARRGAIDGLKELVNNQKTESLHEAFNGKSLRELTDDEFADGINKVLDLVDQVEQPDYVDPEDKKRRVGKILSLASDTMANRELEREDNIYIKQDYQKKKARDKEATRYKNYKTIDDFKINFYRSIKNQVEKVEDEEETYNRINAPFEDDGLIRPGERIDDVPGDIPSVDLYFDMSGSWTGDQRAITIGKQAVATIQEFADKGEIKLNVYYFSNTITTSPTDSCLGGGTGAWDDIIQNIKANHTKNVVLMTDTDMDGDAYNSGVCKVDGEVWIIWRMDNYYYHSGSKVIPEHLVGRKGNHQYAFKANGN